MAPEDDLHTELKSANMTADGSQEENCSRGNFSLSTCSTQVEYIGYLYFYSPVTMIGCVLNMLNIVVFHRSRARTNTMVYLMVMAVFDMLTLFISSPLGLIRCLPRPHTGWQKWASAVYEIYLFLPLANFFSTVSVWLTVVMSMDRYVHVRQSKSARIGDIITARCQRLTILVLIAGAVIINFPYIFYREIDHHGNVKDSEFSETSGFITYTWLRMALVKVIPILLIALANTLLLKVMVDMNKKRKSLVAPFPAKASHQQTQIRVSVMLVSISVVFLLCHVIEPLSHSALYGAIFGACALYRKAHLVQVMVTNTMEMFSYGSNFIFYCIFHVRFRQYLKKLLCCKTSGTASQGKTGIPAANIDNRGTSTRY